MAIEKRTTKAGKASYRVRVASTDPLTGKRQNITIGTFHRKGDAERAEREALIARDRGTLLDPDNTTVGELLKSWLATKAGEITPQSLRDYEIIVRRHLLPALGNVPVQKLTAARLQAQYAAWAAEGMSARMIRGCHMRLSQALKQAVRFGLVASNVSDNVTPPKVSRKRTSVWNPEEASLFLEVTKSDWLHPLWHLLLLEGMRRGEALGLRWRDINWERATAHIVQTVTADKNNRGAALILPRTKTNAGSRTVRLTNQTLSALQEHRAVQQLRQEASTEWHDHDLVICTAKGTPVNPNNVTRSFHSLLRKARLRPIRVHDLRHTSATLLLLAGTPAKVVSERLGHASVGITLDLYSHVLPDMQDKAAEAMDELFWKQATGSKDQRPAPHP